MTEPIERLIMRRYEFRLTMQEQECPYREFTNVWPQLARSEHEARRKMISKCLKDGMWVVLLLSVEDLTK